MVKVSDQTRYFIKDSLKGFWTRKIAHILRKLAGKKNLKEKLKKLLKEKGLRN